MNWNNIKRQALWLMAGVYLASAIAGGIVVYQKRFRMVGQLTPADYQTITNLIACDTTEQILEIIPRDEWVVVNTGTGGVCWHCYCVKRTKKGWMITWKGS
jgi:hypothetical protein